MIEKIGRALPIISVIVVISAVFVVVIAFQRDGYGTEMRRYKDKNDIVVTHTKENCVAKVTIVDTYIKNGEDYYEITTSASGEKIFTLSPAEYDAAFGKGNTAVDCEVYSLTMTVDIVDYYTNILGSQVEHTKYEKLENYKNNPFGLETTFMPPEGQYLICQQENKDGSISKYLVKKLILHGSDTISIKLTETRYSFLGEKDFTEEEIEARKDSMDQLSRHLLEAFLDSY